MEVIENVLVRRWMSPELNAKAVAIRQLQESAGMVDGFRQLTTDPEIGKYIQSITKLAAVDPTVKNFIAWTFKRPAGVLGAFLRGYDRIITGMKKAFTIFNPSFYTGNMVGDALFLSLAGALGITGKVARKIIHSFPPELRRGAVSITSELGVGGRITSSLSSIVQGIDGLAAQGLLSKFQAQAIKQGLVKFQRAGQSVYDLINELNKAPEELARLQERVLRINEGIAARLPRATTPDLPGAPTAVDAIKAKFIGNPDLDDLRRDWMNVAQLEREIPRLREMRAVTSRALEDALSFIGDYNGLGPIERSFFRRLVPFYPFFKAMSQLAFKLPFIMPERAFVWSRLATFAASVSDDPDLPDHMRGYIPAYVMKDGRTLWVSLHAVLPVAALRPARAFNQEIPRIFAFWQANPLISVGLRGVGARDEFFWAGKPKEGEIGVALFDGSIARFRGDGRIETVVPQQGPMDALLSLFPQVRLLEQVTSPYDINRGPRLKPDGTYKYPKNAWERLIFTLGGRTKQGTPEEIIKKEQNFARYVLSKLRRQLRNATPEEKVEIRRILSEASRGYFRRVER